MKKENAIEDLEKEVEDMRREVQEKEEQVKNDHELKLQGQNSMFDTIESMLKEKQHYQSSDISNSLQLVLNVFDNNLDKSLLQNESQA